MGILFIIALVLAWPTFGLSILAWLAYAYVRSQGGASTLAVKGALTVSADRIAQKAASPEAFNGGVGTAFSNEGVEAFFRKYGSTEKRFDYRSDPPMYLGYVKVPKKDEFLAVVLMQNGGSVVASFYPHLSHSQDILGLMSKKLFVDEIASRFAEAAR